MQIDTKFSVGDTVWAIVDNKVKSYRVRDIFYSNYLRHGERGCSYREIGTKYTCEPNAVRFLDEQLFASKEELLASL